MDKKIMMEKLVMEAHEKGIFTGTWLFAEDSKIVSKGAVGWRDLADSLQMKEDSIFELASISKQFTAAAIMLLRKRGLLSLEDEITRFFPESQYRGITIRHLLNHTSGLPDHEEWIIKTLKGENIIPGNDYVVRFLKECGEGPLFAPGEKFEYSNTAYCLLAEIIEQVSDTKFEDFMQKEVFEPAGMFSTRVCHIRKEGIPFEDFARGLVLENGKYVVPDDSEEYHYVIPLDGEAGDGFVYTNILDMFAWDRALREEKLLNNEEQMMMFTPGKLNNGENGGWGGENEIGYGFGWDILHDQRLGLIAWHDGGWPGYDTYFERCIDVDKCLIILCCRESMDGKGFDSFLDGMKAIARGKNPED